MTARLDATRMVRSRFASIGGETMTRFRYLLAPPVLLLFCSSLFGQGTTSGATATCNFDSNKQVAVEYERMTVNVKRPVLGGEIPYNKVWAPGGKPLTLFLNSPVAVGGKELATGAYTMFVIPSEKQWTLIVSKSTDTSGRYDEREDLFRVSMEYGELSAPENEFSIYFAHVAPDGCSMRLDLGSSRAWVIFQEK
jgi:Protein of unknown function (DUF2911)